MQSPILFQRLEAATMLGSTLYFYSVERGNWLVFVLLWFAFDLTMLGYAFGPRLGAYTYNVGHSFLVPAVLATAGVAMHGVGLVQFALVWFAHITLDRLLGYGLKETSGFVHTHLGLIGPGRRQD